MSDLEKNYSRPSNEMSNKKIYTKLIFHLILSKYFKCESIYKLCFWIPNGKSA